MQRSVKIGLLIAGGLAVTGVSTCTVTYLTMQRGIHYAFPVVIDQKPDTMQLHFNHWFPRWRKSFDFTMDGHAWFRDRPQFVANVRTTGTASGGVVQRWQMSHALGHRVQEQRMGSLRYKLTTGWEFLTIWTWKDRSTEREVNSWQASIAAGTATFATSPYLMSMFPSNLQQPTH